MPPHPQAAKAYLTDLWTGQTSLVEGAQQIRSALAEGLRPANAEAIAEARRRSAYDRPLVAAAAGAARGLTFGLSDWALTRSGAASQDALRALQEYSPAMSAAGEVTGAVGGLLIPGGPGARLLGGASRAGAATGEGLAAAARATRTGAGALLRTARRAVVSTSPGAAAAEEAAALARIAARTAPADTLLAQVVGAGVREGMVGAAFGAGQAASAAALDPTEQTVAGVLTRMARGAQQGATVFGALGGGLALGGRAVGAAGKYFSRSADELAAAQKAARAAQADVAAARAVAGDPALISTAASDLTAAQTALASARADSARLWAAGKGPEAMASVEAATERVTLATQRMAAARAAPNAAAVAATERVAAEAAAAEAAAAGAFATTAAGRALGLGLAYATGGGLGLQAMGLLAGPRLLRYLGRIAKPMTGPLGGAVKDLQVGCTPELVRTAEKWPLERMIAGYAAGGLSGLLTQVGVHRVGTAVGGTAVAAAAQKIWQPTVENVAARLGGWATREASALAHGGRTFLADVDRWGEEQARAVASLDLGRLEAQLLGSTNPDVPAELAQWATSRVRDSMEHLKQHSPALNLAPGAAVEPAALAAWKRRAATVTDPKTFFAALDAGELRREHLEAMQAAYPEALGQLRQLVGAQVDRVQAQGGTYAPETARQLALLLGRPDLRPRTWEPERLRALQANLYGTKEPPGPKPRPRAVSGMSRAAQTMGERVQRG